MTSRVFVSALAAVAAIVVVAAPQDPTFEYPAAKHVGFDLPKEDLSVVFQATEKVSVSFRNATVREVLDWLKNQGINFVVADDQVSKDGRVNVNAVNQPIESVMRAFATAWDGHWEKKGDMWVFHKGRDLFGAPAVAGGFNVSPRADLFKVAPGAPQALGGDGQVVTIEGKTAPALGGSVTWTSGDKPMIVGGLGGDGPFMLGDRQKMTKEQEAALEKAMQNMDNPKAWEEFRKAWEKWAKDYEKNFEEFQRTFRNQQFKYKIDEKEAEAMRKHMEDLVKSARDQAKTMPPSAKGFTWDGKEFKPFDTKSLQDMEKRAMEMAKSADQFRLKAGADGKVFTWDGKDMKPMDPKAAKELEKRIADHVKVLGGDGKTFTWRSPEVTVGTSSSRNLKAIYDQLTPTQRLKLARLGYINYSDLNSKQRSLLGVITDDSWTITYKTDKVNITIKSDH